MSKTVTITTAVSLSAKQLEKLEKDLTQKLGKIVVEEKVDPNMVGGVRLLVGSVEYDGTLKAKLEQLRQELHRSLSQ